MVRWTGKRILRLQLFQEVPKLFGGLLSWEHVPFLLLYAVVLQWVRSMDVLFKARGFESVVAVASLTYLGVLPRSMLTPNRTPPSLVSATRPWASRT